MPTRYAQPACRLIQVSSWPRRGVQVFKLVTEGTLEEKIAALKQRHPQAFQMAVGLPEVKKVVNSITTLVKKNLALVTECEGYLRGRYERIRFELGELRNSDKILQYVRDADPSPHFVDGKQ